MDRGRGVFCELVVHEHGIVGVIVIEVELDLFDLFLQFFIEILFIKGRLETKAVLVVCLCLFRLVLVDVVFDNVFECFACWCYC